MGEDDYDGPRILIEYSVIGGKYTSVMGNMDKLREMCKGSKRKQGVLGMPLISKTWSLYPSYAADELRG